MVLTTGIEFDTGKSVVSFLLVGARDLWPLWSPSVSLNLVRVLVFFKKLLTFLFFYFYVFIIIIIILWSSSRTDISSIPLIGTDSS